MGPVHYHAGDFPPRDIDWKRLVPRLNPTATAVARYDSMLGAVLHRPAARTKGPENGPSPEPVPRASPVGLRS